MWHTVEGGADWSYNNWRDRYLRQYHLNQTIQQRRQRVCLPSVPRNSAIRHFAYIFFIFLALILLSSKETKRNHPVPMFGASRLLFYPILQSEDPRIIRTGTFIRSWLSYYNRNVSWCSRCWKWCWFNGGRGGTSALCDVPAST